MVKFQWIVLFCCIFILSCSGSKLEPNFIQPKKLSVLVRVGYEDTLKNKLQTRVYVAEAIKYLEDELNIEINAALQFDFAYSALPDLIVPDDFNDEQKQQFEEFMSNLYVMHKWSKCAGYQNDELPILTFCVFGDFIYKSPVNNGAVLGAQMGPVLVLTNLKDRELFINVMRHEIGHLIGSPHTESGLMIPSVNDDFLDEIVPFSSESVDLIRKNLESVKQKTEETEKMCVIKLKNGKIELMSQMTKERLRSEK